MRTPAHQWICSTCGTTTTVYVKVSEPPTCANNHQTTTMTNKKLTYPNSLNGNGVAFTVDKTKKISTFNSTPAS